MSNHLYMLDEHKNAVPVEDVLTWARWFEAADAADARRVARTQVGELWVSTVFLGTDYNFSSGAPILFETMIYRDTDGEFLEFQERYSTFFDAERGHWDTVMRLRAEREIA